MEGLFCGFVGVNVVCDSEDDFEVVEIDVVGVDFDGDGWVVFVDE